MKLDYQMEKFSSARDRIMIPFPNGESERISMALFECSLGLKNLRVDGLDDDAKRWIQELRRFMDTEVIHFIC